MCSICGGTYSLEHIQQASAVMQHRGPDYSGSFSDQYCSLAHNRLSIIDLDNMSNQPFKSVFCPHLVMVFNGEIYNYYEIKKDLQKYGVPFYTNSDTEVLLHAFAYWGKECLQYFNGDFAFVIYNKQEKEFFIARDRLGNKPLFYDVHEGNLFFASEIKAFLALKNYAFDMLEVSHWLLFGGGHVDKTIYHNIKPFPAAHYAVWRCGDTKGLVFQRYWACSCYLHITHINEALEEIDALLYDAIKIRLRSDVPVALSVSGGIDSSLIAHYIKRIGGDCHFFGVSFKGFSGDESQYIQQLAQDLGIDIEIINPVCTMSKDDLRLLVCTQDEIFRSLSIYAQALLFRYIAPYCNVVLGGQGADEIFGGYYHHAGRYVFKNQREFIKRLYLYGNEAFQEYLLGLKCSLEMELKKKLFEEDNYCNIQKLHKAGLPIPPMDYIIERFLPDFTQSLWLDTIKFNLPHLLRYEDRNAMAVGVENRTPFTDYRIVSLAFQLAEELKLSQGYSKYILRKLLEQLGSSKLAWRKDKIGFAAPESLLMQSMQLQYESIFDVRMALFDILKER